MDVDGFWRGEGLMPTFTGTLLDRLDMMSRTHPHEPALYYYDTVIEWRELQEQIERLAGTYATLGVKSGDRVGVMLQNIPAFLVAQFAAWWLGAIVVPLNVMLRERELAFYLEDAGVQTVVALTSVVPEVRRAARRLQAIIAVPDDQDFAGRRPSFIPQADPPGADVLLYAEALRGKALPPQSVSPSSVAYLNYTSGTTGPPKGAMNTHRNIVYNAEVYARWAHLGPGDVNVAFAPFFHITGSVAGIATSIFAGIPLALLYRFEPKAALAAIERYRATFTVGAITTYLALLSHPDIKTRDVSSFTKAYTGGAPVSPAIVEQFEAVTGHYIHNCYGLTETTSPATAVPLGVRAPVDPASGALSVGVPIPGVEAVVVDLDDPSQTVETGRAGELALKGPPIVPGYWRKPEESSQAIRDGWLLTGDVAVKDADGWVYIVDRKKDMIIASGYKVWPREVEDVLYQHPAIREAAVVGMADPYRGETVRAYVSLQSGQTVEIDDLIAFCRQRLAAYKVPRAVTVLDEVPKTVTGKFLRRLLRSRDHEGTRAVEEER